MAKAKSEFKKETITVRKGDIDPAIKVAFRRVCNLRGVRVGEMLADLMEQKIRDTFGPGADRIIEESRRHHEALAAQETLDRA